MLQECKLHEGLNYVIPTTYHSARHIVADEKIFVEYDT